MLAFYTEEKKNIRSRCFNLIPFQEAREISVTDCRFGTAIFSSQCK